MNHASRKSRTLATWLAIVGGTFGLHRFYLHGVKDFWAWMHPLPTLVGLTGLWRVQQFGQDDPTSWLMLPVLGFMVAAAMLQAIAIGLTREERWTPKFSPGGTFAEAGWLTVMGVVVALMLGAGVLMATIAFSGQRYFESQVEEGLKLSQ